MTTTLSPMQTTESYRLYDDHSEHNLILPLEISSLLAQTKGNIAKAYRPFHWLVTKGFFWQSLLITKCCLISAA